MEGEDHTPERAYEEIDRARMEALDAALRGAPEDVAELAMRRIRGGASEENCALFQKMRAATLADAMRYGEALEAAGEVIRIDGGSHTGWFLRGTVLHMSGDLAGSLEAYGRAAGLADGARKADMMARMAGVLGEMGRDGECLAAAAGAREMDPGGADAAALEAACLNRMGRHGEALARAESPRDGPPDARMEEQRVLALAGAGRSGEALAAANHMIKAGRAGAAVWHAKARLLARAGRSEPAIDALTVAVALDPRVAAGAAGGDDLAPLRGDARFRRVTGGSPYGGAAPGGAPPGGGAPPP